MDGEWPPKWLAFFNAIGVATFCASLIVAALILTGVIGRPQ